MPRGADIVASPVTRTLTAFLALKFKLVGSGGKTIITVSVADGGFGAAGVSSGSSICTLGVTTSFSPAWSLLGRRRCMGCSERVKYQAATQASGLQGVLGSRDTVGDD